jgi:hypothetical protein
LERHLRLLSTERRRRIGRRFTLWWIFTIPSCGLYFNVGIDDKFGFEAETDWVKVIEVLGEF